MNIDVEQLDAIFEKMASTDFDVNEPLEWSFYFVNKSKKPLEHLYAELNGHHYMMKRFEKISAREWLLQVSKVEVLSKEKLHRRNIGFNELATYCEVDLYDGWDVGKI